jgi:hypothetical protein
MLLTNQKHSVLMDRPVEKETEMFPKYNPTELPLFSQYLYSETGRFDQVDNRSTSDENGLWSPILGLAFRLIVLVGLIGVICIAKDLSSDSANQMTEEAQVASAKNAKIIPTPLEFESAPAHTPWDLCGPKDHCSHLRCLYVPSSRDGEKPSRPSVPKLCFGIKRNPPGETPTQADQSPRQKAGRMKVSIMSDPWQDLAQE